MAPPNGWGECRHVDPKKDIWNQLARIRGPETDLHYLETKINFGCPGHGEKLNG
jgi:hypothetical protein